MPRYTDPETGKVIVSQEELSPEELEEAFSVVKSELVTKEPSNDSKGGGFLGRLGEDLGGVASLATDIGSESLSPETIAFPWMLPAKVASRLIPKMYEGAVETGAEQATPYIEALRQDPSVLGKIGRGTQALMSTIPGLGRTVQSGEDYVAGKEGAGGELIYDTLAALSPKMKVNVNPRASLRNVGEKIRPNLGEGVSVSRNSTAAKIGKLVGGALGSKVGHPFLGMAAGEKIASGSNSVVKVRKAIADLLDPKPKQPSLRDQTMQAIERSKQPIIEPPRRIEIDDIEPIETAPRRYDPLDVNRPPIIDDEPFGPRIKKKEITASSNPIQDVPNISDNPKLMALSERLEMELGIDQFEADKVAAQIGYKPNRLWRDTLREADEARGVQGPQLPKLENPFETSLELENVSPIIESGTRLEDLFKEVRSKVKKQGRRGKLTNPRFLGTNPRKKRN